MTEVGLIGCGGMAQDVVAALRAAGAESGVRIVGALARPGRGEAAPLPTLRVLLGYPPFR